MTTPQGSWPLNTTGNVTLDASGNGTVQLRPDGPQEHWSLSLASFKTAQTSITNEAQCRIYIGPVVSDQYFVDGTLSGSTGDSTGKVAGYDISRTGPLPSVWAVWSGGDPGAIATLSISGSVSFGQGGGIPFSAAEGCSNPIIGGGGALVYPSIHSPNFVQSPLTGWAIEKNGNAFFGNITATGSIIATMLEILSGGNVVTEIDSSGNLKVFNSHGAVIYYVEPSKDAWFLYADTGSASQGALLVSAASASGTDDFGNTFEAGLAVYVTATAPGSAGRWALNLSQLNSGLPSITFSNLASAQNIPPFIDAAGSGSAGVGSELALSSGVGVAGSVAATLQLFDTVASGISNTLIDLNAAQVDVFGFIEIVLAAASNNAFIIEVSGDTGSRLRIDSNGKLNWGSGSAATDTTLGRNAANQLLTGGSVVFTGISAPSTPAAGDAALYATTAGTPAEVLPSGFQGELVASPAADFTHFTVTAAAATQATKAWSIPANDAQVGTTYRLTFIGSGTQGSTAESLKFQFSNGDAAGTCGSGLAGTSAAFSFKCVLEVTVITTGSGGTANYSMWVQCGAAAAIGFTQAGAFNTTNAFTLEGQTAWGSTTGSPTMTCFQSYYERIGP